MKTNYKVFLAIILLVSLKLFSPQHNLSAAIADSSFAKYTPFHWEAISDVDKVLQHENAKNLNKKVLDQTKLGNESYTAGVNKMQEKNYIAAIEDFKEALKKYQRAKLSPDAYNYIYTNLALCNIKTGNNKDLVVAKRYVNMLTKTIHKEENWLYNIAIVHYFLNEKDEAATLLSNCIKMNEFDYQAYATLKAIYEESGNTKSAEKVNDAMQSAQAKQMKANQANTHSDKSPKKGKVVIQPANGIAPNINNLSIVAKDNILQFNNIDKIDERSMDQIQQGIGSYNDGIKALRNKEYDIAIDALKEAEKRLKRGKIADDGMNFVWGNLAIAYLSKNDTRGKGQAKRYLKYLTNKIYKTREWTYNLAIAYYAFGDKEKSLELLQLATKQDKLYLLPYQNMIYIYNQMEEGKKALASQKSYEKNRDELVRSFSKQDQEKYNVTDPYIFRVNLGTFGEFDAPEGLFNENNLISIPLDNETTTYLAGIFENFDDALTYQKEMKTLGYPGAFVVAFRDGEKLEF